MDSLRERDDSQRDIVNPRDYYRSLYDELVIRCDSYHADLRLLFEHAFVWVQWCTHASKQWSWCLRSEEVLTDVHRCDIFLPLQRNYLSNDEISLGSDCHRQLRFLGVDVPQSHANDGYIYDRECCGDSPFTSKTFDHNENLQSSREGSWMTALAFPPPELIELC